MTMMTTSAHSKLQAPARVLSEAWQGPQRKEGRASRLDAEAFARKVVHTCAFWLCWWFLTAAPGLAGVRAPLWVGGGALAFGLALDLASPAPSAEELAQLDPLNIPAFDRPYAGGWNEQAGLESDILMGTGLILPLIASPDSAARAAYAEVVLVSAGGVMLTKGLVGRYRPYAYGIGAPYAAKHHRSTTNSFFSGHATLMTTGFVYFASRYHQQHQRDPLRVGAIWSACLGAAAYGSWARVRAGMHFPSDVALGFAWGAFSALALPKLSPERHGKWAYTRPLGPELAWTLFF